jgi:hypothetical protein
VDCDCGHCASGTGFETHSCRRDGFSGGRIDEVHAIQIRLQRFSIGFPVAAEIALGWNPGEWWCYLLKFSHRFSQPEIGRCQGLGMPSDLVRGMGRLRGLSPAAQLDEQSWNDLAWAEPESDFLKQARFEAEEQGSLMMLITAFLEGSLVTEANIGGTLGPYSRWFVRWVWHDLPDEKKTKALYEDFIGFLERQHMLND